MSKRTLWLVAYDIACPYRLREVLCAVRTWSTGGQKSVHECWLTRGELALLRRELAAIVDLSQDSVLFLPPDPSRGVRTLGLAQRPRDPRFFVVG
ncbi:MAG: CRISPR-associated protein Cas2 [Geminicoccaceae bacterium]